MENKDKTASVMHFVKWMRSMGVDDSYIDPEEVWMEILLGNSGIDLAIATGVHLAAMVSDELGSHDSAEDIRVLGLINEYICDNNH